MRRSILCASLLLALLTLPGLGRTATAQTLADASLERGPRFLLASASRVSPLDVATMPVLSRRLALELEGVTLKQALTAISRQSGLRLVYNDAVLPLGQLVHLRAEAITVAAALTDLLLGSGVDVVFRPDGEAALVKRPAPPPTGTIVGRVSDKKTGSALAGATVVVEGTSRSATTSSDGRYRIAAVPPGTYTVQARYIGYAPGSASVTVSADQEATADFTLEKSAQRLDEVVTTGTLVPTEVKALPTPISVITAEDIQQQSVHHVDQLFRGLVPGANAWDQGAGDNDSQISVRGASTISADPTIKTFIDGVEVANPVDIAQIDPNTIDRIEIIRGPQASTLYGAGALSGVMQIFTKRGRLGLTRPEITGTVSVGSIGGYNGSNAALLTDDALALRGGNTSSSYNIGGSYSRIGEWQPQYHGSTWGLATGAQTTQGNFDVSVSMRFSNKAFDLPWDTRFQSYTYYSRPSFLTDHFSQQTYGLTAAWQPTGHWRHTLTLGYDQDNLDYHQTQLRLTTPSDTFLGAAETRQSKRSLLYHTDLTIQLARAISTVVTGGVNYTGFDYVRTSSFGTQTTGNADGFLQLTRNPSHDFGYFGQIQLNLFDRLFLTGGVRGERTPNFGEAIGTAWSPRVGASYAFDLGSATVKLRASYGASIRPPELGQRSAFVTPSSVQLANPNLAPEQQRGGDGGIDISLAGLSLGVTYYSQRAIDLIDLATLTLPSDTIETIQFQNLSRVRNTGWEFEARFPLGPLQFAGTYSITNSTIQALPPNFEPGSYTVGDRVLGVPHSTAGATVSITPLPHTLLTASMTYIGSWVENDRIALIGRFFGGQPYRGSQRAYWMDYPSVAKFAVRATQRLSSGVDLFASAENVGNNQRFELNNAVISTPRRLTLGANLRY